MTSSRINRIIGQLKGIERMMESGREPTEILQQISAIKKAIDGMTREIVLEDVCQGADDKARARIERIVDRVMSM